MRRRRSSSASLLDDFVRLYAFLSQIVTFTDADLEKSYVYGRAASAEVAGQAGRTAGGNPEEHRHGFLPGPADIVGANQA